MAVIKDEVDVEKDTNLATFVINSHMKCHPESNEEELKQSLLEEDFQISEFIPQDLLKKYILYAKRYVQPKLSDIDRDKISQFYAQLRKEAEKLGGIPVGVRHVESILRMAESNAKMHLREYVKSDDVDLAIEMMLKSFLQSQKYSVANSLNKAFSKFLTRNSDNEQMLLHILDQMFQNKLDYLRLAQPRGKSMEVMFPKAAFELEAKDISPLGISQFLNSKSFSKKYILKDNNIIKK